jgi:hypothetical protein
LNEEDSFRNRLSAIRKGARAYFGGVNCRRCEGHAFGQSEGCFLVVGQQTVDLLRQHTTTKNMPILLMATKEEYDTLDLDQPIAADSFLLKPFTPQWLIFFVRSHIRHRASTLSE